MTAETADTMLQDFRRSDPVLGTLVLGDGSTARTTILRRDALEPLTPGTQSEATPSGRSGPVGPRRDRLHDLVERRTDEYRRFGRARHPAIEAPDAVLTYDDLDIAANRLARFLLALSLAPGDRVAVLLERAVDDLVAQLAIAKLGAVWIPLERTDSAGGHAAVVAGTGVGIVLTSARSAPLLGACEASVVVLDRHAGEVSLYAPLRWRPDDRITWVDSPASIITRRERGTTQLQATAVGHDAAINTVRATAAMLQLGPRDRVFHDPLSASEFAVLDAWLPWACGATLIVPPSDVDTRGGALERLLRERRVTVLRADARTLAAITPDLPDLRLVLVTGPDRPVDVIARWQRPGRRLIALHGSPETGPAALHTELRPDRSARTERPLPTYGVVVLDPAHPDRRLPVGAIGQIGITGAGLARGYVGRPGFTGETFVVDAEGTRIFRTGDLGRITSTGEVERTGRITSERAPKTDPPLRAPEPRQVRPRSPLAPRPPGGSTRPSGPSSRPVRRGPAVGHPSATVRIVRRPQNPPVSGVPAASAAVVAPAADESAEAARTLSLLGEVLREVLQRDDIPGGAHFFDDLGADSMLMARFCARVRKHPELPSVSMHDVYNHSTPAALAAALSPTPAAPASSTGEEQLLLETLREVLGRTDITATSHFFDDLGADSMLMARLCARVRKRLELPWPSIQDVYRHPTAKELAAAHQPADAGVVLSEREPEPSVPAPAPMPSRRAGTAAFVLCGVAQALCVLGYAYLTAAALAFGFEWVTVPLAPVDTYLRAVTVSAAGFIGLALLPIAAKWLLVGRWRPRTIRIWSLGYLRFWLVKTLVSTNPMVLFAGSPLYNLYLRALGAKIGRGAVLLSSRVVCTDVFSVGAGSLIRKDAFVSCYRARDGYIEIGGISLGAGVVIGEATVLDVCTTVGDDASLSHSSALYAGQTVPSGESWHGSPGRPATTPVPQAPAMRCGTLRRALYSTLSLAVVLGVVLPAGVALAAVAYRAVPWLTTLLEPGPGALSDGAFYGRTVLLSALVYFGAVLVGLVLITSLPRLLAALVRPDRTYPLYGLHYWLHQAVVVTTNVRAFVALFGDSSAIPYYLRLIGYRLRPLVQTGSNFGMAVKHENPYLTAVGSETVVADGLSVMNADYSSTSFRVSTTRIGARNFLGNRIAYPPQGRTGDDCLLATKVAVPTDGVLREGVGLLGSPSFEIPRTVARDSNLDTLDAAAVRSSLRRKNRHNLTTVLIHLVARWVPVLVAAFAVGVMAALPVSAGAAEIVIVELLLLFTTTLWFVLAERSVSRLKAHAPDGCSIYDRAFWRHERHWKAAPQEWMQLFNGTPLKGLVWRMLGVRIGRRTFDDGLSITEKAFVTVGDDCVFNAGSVIQCHSQEDGAFKSDLVVVGSRADLGVAAFVHYGTTIGDDTLLEADSFLMKGEEIAAGERWGGNPARELA